MKTLLVAVAVIVATLAGSWLASFVGFRAHVRAGSPDRAVAWTKVVGQLTGLVVVVEVIVFALVLIF
jgi:hypothetical protein